LKKKITSTKNTQKFTVARKFKVLEWSMSLE